MNSGLNFYYFAFLLRLLPFVVIAECGSIPEVLSVTRSSDEGDSFALKASSSASCQSVCEQRDAVSSSTRATVQGTAICPCQCGQPQKPTFFVTKSGRQSCGSDRDVLVKINGDICDFYFDSVQKLKVLDVQLAGKYQLRPFGFCDHLQMRETKFHYNTSWISTNSNLFNVFVRKRGNSGKPINFLSWNSSVNSFYNGLLIKLTFGCTYNGKTDDRCVVFKTRGTSYYVDIATRTSSSPIIPTSLPVDVAHTAKKSTVDVPSLSTADSLRPTAADSKVGNRNVWIVVALGLSALLVIVIVGIVGFLVLRCQRKCISQRTARQRHHQVTCDRSPMSPIHDYEYIHYPCLTGGLSSPPHTPTGRPMYERGPNNKLIIWSEGHNPTKRQSVEASAPRLPYQRLLARASSTSGDCGVVVRPLSPAYGDVFPYQKLVRTEAQVEGQQVGCSTERCAGCGDSTAEPGRENYRSLAPLEVSKCAPEDCEKCTSKLDGPRPDTAECDYAPVPVSLDNSRLEEILLDSSSYSNKIPRTSEEDGCVGDFGVAVVNAVSHSVVAGEDGSKPSSEFEGAGTDGDRNAEFSTPACFAKRERVSPAGSQRCSEIDETSHEYMELEALKTAEDQTVEDEHEET